MLGDYTGSSQTAQTDPRNGSSSWDVYLQDSWKVTRKLTLDYGLRWDLFTVQHEEYGRLGQFSETVINDNAGNNPAAPSTPATAVASSTRRVILTPLARASASRTKSIPRRCFAPAVA